jgi:hypothetical protein
MILYNCRHLGLEWEPPKDILEKKQEDDKKNKKRFFIFIF